MKKNFLLGAVAIALFSACNKDVKEGVKPEAGAATHLSMKFALAGEEYMRAATQADENGTEEESKVTSTVLYLSDAENKVLTEKPGTPAGTADKFWESQPWATSVTGSRTMAVVLNSPAAVTAATPWDQDLVFPIANITQGTQHNDNLNAVATNNKFTMSTSAFVGNVRPGIAADAVLALESNLFQADAERVVAKAVVHAANPATMEIKPAATAPKVAEAKDLKFAVGHGAAKTYLFRTKAGSRKMNAQGVYENFQSAIHAEQDGTVTGLTKLVRLGDIGATALAGAASPYAPIAVNNANASLGRYFFENSYAANEGQFKYTRVAYVKVYAKVVPVKVMKLSADGQSLEVGNASDLQNNGTFFLGETDRVIYATAAAAKKAIPNQKSYMYKEGKAVWLTPVNRVLNEATKKTKSCDTRRNNIYDLTISNIANIGYNYDPNDPNDPNIPKPNDNGDEPVTPPDGGDPNVDKNETHMAVKVKILPWNKVTSNVVLN